MHELMRWEHHKCPVNEGLLDEMCISGTSDEIVFVFRNKNLK